MIAPRLFWPVCLLAVILSERRQKHSCFRRERVGEQDAIHKLDDSHKQRAFLTARNTHVPTAEALELAFLEYFLKHAPARRNGCVRDEPELR
jgi:hypothetical protein